MDALSWTPDFSSEIDSLEDQVKEFALSSWALDARPTQKSLEGVSAMMLAAVKQFGDSKSSREITLLPLILEQIKATRNPKLACDCLLFVFNLEERSQSEIARVHGVTKADVSSLCKRLCKRLQLPPSRGMKSARACEVYAERAKESKRRLVLQPKAWIHEALFKQH